VELIQSQQMTVSTRTARAENHARGLQGVTGSLSKEFERRPRSRFGL
jgi:hypothetical protein